MIFESHPVLRGRCNQRQPRDELNITPCCTQALIDSLFCHSVCSALLHVRSADFCFFSDVGHLMQHCIPSLHRSSRKFLPSLELIVSGCAVNRQPCRLDGELVLDPHNLSTSTPRPTSTCFHRPGHVAVSPSSATRGASLWKPSRTPSCSSRRVEMVGFGCGSQRCSEACSCISALLEILVDPLRINAMPGAGSRTANETPPSSHRQLTMFQNPLSAQWSTA